MSAAGRGFVSSAAVMMDSTRAVQSKTRIVSEDAKGIELSVVSDVEFRTGNSEDASTVAVGVRNTSRASETTPWLSRIKIWLDFLFLPQKKAVTWISAFHSEAAVLQERKRQMKENRHIIHPLSIFLKWWEGLIIVVLSITMVLLPVRTAFYPKDTGGIWMTCNLIIDIILLIEIVVNFRTAYIHSDTDEIILDNRRIAMNYLKHGFIFDLVSSLPLEYVVLSTSSGSDDNVRVAMMLRFLKVFRFVRLFRYIEKKFLVMVKIDVGVISLCKLILSIILYLHWNGCLQYFAAYMQGFPDDCWVILTNLHVGNKPVFLKYSHSVFRSLSHMVSVGYGHAKPINTLEIWLTIISCIVGATFYAMLIGHMSLLIMGSDYSGQRFIEKMCEVKEFMKYRKLPLSLQKEILAYYEHRYQRHLFDERILIKEENMSPILKEKILLHTSTNLVKKVGFLADAPRDLLVKIVSKLHLKNYFPKETIIHAGDRGTCMYFIEQGKVDVFTPDGKYIGSVEGGGHVGEIALLGDTPRSATIKAAEICDIHVLQKVDFVEILKDYPEMREKLQLEANERLTYLAENTCADGALNPNSPTAENTCADGALKENESLNSLTAENTNASAGTSGTEDTYNAPVTLLWQTTV